MKFATLKSDERDGRLVLVSPDHERALDVSDIAPNLLHAVENWGSLAPALRRADERLRERPSQAMRWDARQCMAPLPRCYQWCDASAFLNHGRLMQRAFNLPPVPDVDSVPLMYQGASDSFLGPYDDVHLPDEAHGIDFEGEFGVVVDDVPLGVSPDDAQRHILLLVQLNDWSLRAFGAREMKRGFGFLQAKPSTSFAPIALTPDELGVAWRRGRIDLELHVELNSAWFGHPHAGMMHYSFGELIAHAAETRGLSAGTIIGSGTISNPDHRVGAACIAERRALEIVEQKLARTPFMAFGDRVRMEARAPGSSGGPFGVIDQRVVRACRA